MYRTYNSVFEKSLFSVTLFKFSKHKANFLLYDEMSQNIQFKLDQKNHNRELGAISKDNRNRNLRFLSSMKAILVTRQHSTKPD